MPSIIDRQKFLDEISRNPDLVSKMASMVRGEVGLGRDLTKEIIQLESAFNRAQVRDHSLQRSLLSVAESPKGGYYAKDTYSKAATPEQVKYFKENILNPVLAGSNEGERFLGHPVTGNASQMGFAGKRLAEGTYAAGKWYGNPGGGSEMFVLEKADAPNLHRLGTGTAYAGLDQSNVTPPPASVPGTTLTSTPAATPVATAAATPVATAATPEPTAMNKFSAALMGAEGKAGPDSGIAGLTQIASGLGLGQKKVPQALPPPPQLETSGGSNSAQAQALMAILLQNRRNPQGLTLTGGGLA